MSYYRVYDVIRLREYGLNFYCKCTDLEYLYGTIEDLPYYYDLNSGILHELKIDAPKDHKRLCDDRYDHRGNYFTNNIDIYRPKGKLSPLYHRVIKFLANPTTDTDKFTKAINSLGFEFKGKLQMNYLGGWNVIDPLGHLRDIAYLITHLKPKEKPDK